MKTRPTLFTMAVVALTALPVLMSAQPSSPPGGVTGSPSQPPTSKSDEHRVVGRVLHIDREGGLVKLATDEGVEGVVVVQAPPQTLRVIRVGEMVSVPRSAGESPSASPRQ